MSAIAPGRVDPLPRGSDPRPTGKGWRLVDYSWDEQDGVGKFVYRRDKERQVVAVRQPAGCYHDGWATRPPIDHDAALARYFGDLHVQFSMPPSTYLR